jgi:hypothetical protein
VSPRFPDLRPRDRAAAGDLTAGDDSLKLAPGDDPGELTAGGDPSDLGDLGDGGKLADGGDGMLSATRPGTTDPARPGTADRPEQPALSDAVDDGADGSSARDGEPTQPALTSTTAETTQPTPAADPATTTQPTPPAANGTAGPANGEAGPGPDATQRLEPVGNNGPKSRPSKPASKESKGGS